MEMESSRRPSFDRSRELGLKRARLAEDPNLNNRPFPQKQQRPASGAAVSAASARFRVNSERDRDSDESSRVSYQQPSQLQQHQELISQYKAALAELTFNSKPIITNLTIIAGENTHAAKAIAGTICTNIIEICLGALGLLSLHTVQAAFKVPSDQKLPSLYLLDSIVKNIGRDYIKYFAAKLPEVFCKAYRQVDSPVHSSMQHLFGTWKGVFPPQPLQIIERELGFLAAANGSSSASTTSRPDSQAQRQPHSIHVNPKYLEARQRLQQSGRTVQQTQREELRETVHEKPPGVESEDHEYGSGLSRHIASRLGKSSERITDHSFDKQWSSAGRGVEELMPSQRNGVNAPQSTPSHMASRSANVHLLPTQSVASRSSRDLPRSWKNSEEEEYMWDELNPGGTDHVAVVNIQRDHWTVDGRDKSEFGGRNTNRLNQAVAGSRIDREIDSLSSEQLPIGRQRSSSWQSQEQLLVQGSDTPPPRTVFQSHAAGASSFGLPTLAASGPTGSHGHRHGASGKPLISQPSSRDPRLNFSEKESAQANSLPLPNRKPALPSRSSDMGPQNPKVNDSFVGVHHNLHLDNNRKSEPQSLQKMTTSVSSLRAKQYNVSSQQLPLGLSETEPSSGFPNRVKQLGSSSGTLNHVTVESAGQLNTSALLAALLKNAVPPGPLADSAQPSSSTGPSQASLADPRFRSSSSSGSPHDVLSLLLQRKADESPQSSGPPPTSSLTRTSNSDGTSSSQNSFSSLLNTLVAKGLITASKAESAPPASKTESAPLASKTESVLPASPPLSSKSKKQSPSIATTKSAEVPSVSVSSDIPSSTTDNHASSKAPIPSSTTDKLASSKAPYAAPQASQTEIVSLIGFEFKPDILRQFHPSVVDGLFEDLTHPCSICGLRLKLKERLDRHLEWHASKQSEVDKSSGMWYVNSDHWVAGKAAVDSGSNIVGFSQESGKASEEDPEPMVPADESHCVCLLCGELFEDFYSLERDEWMFKGAVYMTVSSESGTRASSSQTAGQGVIVHAKCMADDSVQDLDLANVVKLEKDV